MTHEYNKQSKEYKEYVDRWKMVDDVVRSRVKKEATKYLPKPNPHDLSERNTKAYENYLKRAVFYNFTKPTQNTLLGSMFRKPIEIDIQGFDYIESDIDGGGLGFRQQAKDAARELTETSRCGFFVDYTSTEPASNRAEELQIGARPVAILYKAVEIIDVKTVVTNSVKKLSKVVLAEYEDEESQQHDRERVLMLDESGLCVIQVYRYKDGQLVSMDESMPTNAAGARLDYIPFVFCGGLNNDESIDDALLYDLAVLNISHYQSSADYEDFRFKLGQVQPFISGATSAEIDKNGGKLDFGSGVAWVFGENASAQLLQAQPNSANMESMQHKEDQAKAIGAKLVNPNQKVMSDNQTDTISANETASIVTIAANLEAAYRDVFEMMLDRVQSGFIEIEFSKEFVKFSLESAELKELGQLVRDRVIPDAVLFSRMRKAGFVAEDETDEDLRAMIANNPEGLGLGAQ